MAEHEPCVGKSDDWYTPREIFDALKLTFDLDPCSPGPGHWVPARSIYTKEDDGLIQPWSGLVWMNPPFGGRHGHIPWLRKFMNHSNGVVVALLHRLPDRRVVPRISRLRCLGIQPRTPLTKQPPPPPFNADRRRFSLNAIRFPYYYGDVMNLRKKPQP